MNISNIDWKEATKKYLGGKINKFDGDEQSEIKPFVDNKVEVIDNEKQPRINQEGYTVDKNGNILGTQYLGDAEPVVYGMSPETRQKLYMENLQKQIEDYYDHRYSDMDVLDIEKDIEDDEERRRQYEYQRDLDSDRLVGTTRDAEDNLASIVPGSGYVGSLLHGAKGTLDYAFGDKGLADYEWERAGNLAERSFVPTAIAASLSTGNPYIAGAIDGTFMGSAIHDIDENGLNPENAGMLALSSLGPITRIGAEAYPYARYYKDYLSTPEIGNTGSSMQIVDDMLGKKGKEQIERILNSDEKWSNQQLEENIGVIDKVGEELNPTTYKPDGSIKKPGGDRRAEILMANWMNKGAEFNEHSAHVMRTVLKIAKEHKLNDQQILKYKNPYEFMEAYGEKPKLDPINPKDVPEFTHEKSLRDGIDIYTVEDTPEGQKAVRSIVDTHLGPEYSPWCLAAAENTVSDRYTTPLEWWNKYDDGPKKIAFKDGKVIAFYAGGAGHEPAWYNLQDRARSGIEVTQKSNGTQYKYIINENNDKTIVDITKGQMGNPGVNIRFDAQTELPYTMQVINNDKTGCEFDLITKQGKSPIQGQVYNVCYGRYGNIRQADAVNTYGVGKNNELESQRRFFINSKEKLDKLDYRDLFDQDIEFEMRGMDGKQYIYMPKRGKVYRIDRYTEKLDSEHEPNPSTMSEVDKIMLLIKKPEVRHRYEAVEINDGAIIKEMQDYFNKAKKYYEKACEGTKSIQEKALDIKLNKSLEKVINPLSDEEIQKITLDGIKDSTGYYRSEKFKKELLDNGHKDGFDRWTEEDYNALQRELDEVEKEWDTKGGSNIEFLTPEQMEEITGNEDQIGRNIVSEDKNGTIKHAILLNKGFFKDPWKILEAIYHEFGGHGMTANTSTTSNEGIRGIMNKKFPMIHKLMQHNAIELRNLQLKPEWRYVKRISDRLRDEGTWMNIIQEWHEKGLSDAQISKMYVELEGKVGAYRRHIENYLMFDQEAATRLRSQKMLDELSPERLQEYGLKPADKIKGENELSMEEVFTPKSVELVKKMIFTLIPFLLAKEAIINGGQNKEPEMRSEGGNIGNIDWKSAAIQFMNGGTIKN